MVCAGKMMVAESWPLSLQEGKLCSPGKIESLVPSAQAKGITQVSQADKGTEEGGCSAPGRWRHPVAAALSGQLTWS